MQLGSKLKDKYNRNSENRRIRKEQNFYEKLLRKSSNDVSVNIFNKRNMSITIIIITLFLQLISLVTTYKGSKVYFGGVELPFGISGALLFALAVQIVVYTVSNGLRNNFKKGIVVILFLATFCSTYFSYIGIYNYMNSPISYLEERYKLVYKKMTEQYSSLLEENKTSMKSEMAKIINNLSSQYTNLKMEIDKNNELQNKIDNITIDSNGIDPQTNTLQKPNINDYNGDLDAYYEAMQKYNSAVGSMVTDSTKQDGQLKNDLYNEKVKSILGGKTEDEFKKESINTKTKYEELEKGINRAYELIATSSNEDIGTKLSKIEEYCQDFIIDGTGESDVFTTVATNLYSQLEMLDTASEIKDFRSNLNSFITVSKKDTKLMLSVDEVKDNIFGNNKANYTDEKAMNLYTEMADEINSGIYTLNLMLDDNSKIKSTDEDYNIYNLYVLPIMNLITDNSNRIMSLFCLLFAILVDGLTLIFAIVEGRDKSALFAKKNTEIINTSSESLDELLLVTLLSTDTISKDEKRVESALSKLDHFIKSFQLIPETMEYGYSMYTNIDNLKGYEGFIAILCQFNLGKVIKGKELFIDSEEEDNNTYLLIKSKFVIWINDKIATLTLNSQYINSVNSNRNFDMEGVLP